MDFPSGDHAGGAAWTVLLLPSFFKFFPSAFITQSWLLHTNAI
jgi:hypothetical protein